MTRRLCILISIAALAIGLAACSSSSKSSDAGSGGGTTTDKITIKDFSFTGATVKAGATVTVENNGPSTHTVTADGSEFNTGNIDSGKTATFTAPAKPGTYKYHCNIHTSMTGTLTVT
jgi:plastocyanin